MRTNVVWKGIPGFEGKYQASTSGLIKSLPRLVRGRHASGTEFLRRVPGRILKPGPYCKSGHVSVVLGKGVNGIPVHQLIAKTFLGELPENMEVLHINGNPKDNRVSNIRYGSRTENILDVYYQGKSWRKLNISQVRQIRRRLKKGETGTSIAKDYSVSDSAISAIKTGRCYSWL